jgi:parvulin-like peptidyl-prolyl isomerase
MMMKRILLAAVSLVIPAITIANPVQEVDGVAAYVNEHIITISDVIRTSRTLMEQTSQEGIINQNDVYNEALEDVIGRKLILDDYENQKEIQIPESIFDERADAIIRDMFDGNRLDFIEALASDELSENVWRAQMREKTIVGAMRNLRVDSKVTVSPLAAREIYDVNRDRYTTQPSIKLRMIVIAKGATEAEKPLKQKKLDEVLKALKEGGDFSELAKSYSEDSYAADGGNRDWMKADMLRKDLADAAFATKVGEISAVVDIGKQVFIIKVEDRVESKVVSFEDAKPLVEQQLRMEQSVELHDAWVDRLRKNAYIKIVKRDE